MGLRLDRRGFLMLAGATAVTTLPSRRSAMRAHMIARKPHSVKPELANV